MKKRKIELRLNRDGDATSWDKLPVFDCEVTTEIVAAKMAQRIARDNNGQVRWNWAGDNEGRYSDVFYKDVVTG